MSREDVYFQFPIGALRFNKSIDEVTKAETVERWGDIGRYCLCEFGRKNWSKWENAQELAIEYFASVSNECKCDPSVHSNACIYFAASVLGLRLLGSTCELRWKSHAFINSLTDHGSTLVRVRHDVFVDCSSMGWRDWALLCGVYAALGNRYVVQLSYNHLNALAMGYNSKKLIPEDLYERCRLTDRKTQISTDRLSKRNLFSKASPNRRHKYYSKWRLPVLMEYLANLEAKKIKKRQQDGQLLTASEVTKQIQEAAKRR